MSITPHIVVGSADRAAAFYRDAFGAQERQPLTDVVAAAALPFA